MMGTYLRVHLTFRLTFNVKTGEQATSRFPALGRYHPMTTARGCGDGLQTPSGGPQRRRLHCLSRWSPSLGQRHAIRWLLLGKKEILVRTPRPTSRIREVSLPIRAGLIAGSVAAIAGALVNLPLHSPSDAFFNSAAVMVGSLAAGFSAGLLWHVLGLVLGYFPAWGGHRWAFFGACMALAFGLVSLIAVLAETQVERSVSYFVPLAALVFGIIGSLVLLLLRVPQILWWRLTILTVVVAIAIGVALAGQGDQKSGALELPPRATISNISSFPS